MADVFAKSSLKSGASLVALGLMLGSSAAFAGGLPHGGHYVAGHGTLNKATQSLTVKQSSIAGIIDWKGFSVGKHGSVTFDNGSGATLNRVTGGNLSRIAGTLHATGSLYLINSSGVIVSGTGRVLTGGSFIASSGTLSNSAFDSHERRFGDADAKVINRGSITSGDEAKLVGSSVTNTGTITGAHVKLRATERDILAAGTIRAIGDAHHDAHILVISDTGETRIAGALIAHNRDGSGGDIETSGRKLSIAGKIDAGKGGTWLVDPENLTVGKKAAKTIDASLNGGTNVILQTTKTSTSGPGISSTGLGDITIDANLSWDTSAELKFVAYHSVYMDANVDVSGEGALAISTKHQGNFSIADGSAVTFASASSVMRLNGANYKLVANIATLASDIKAHPSGHYALMADYDASADGTYTRSPIGKTFTGKFQGLGHSISNLTIDDSTESQGLGLFSAIGTGGSVRNLQVLDVSIAGANISGIGALAGLNNGMIVNVETSGTLSADSTSNLGGLVGINSGSVEQSQSTASVSAATGTVEGQGVGGLIGSNFGTASSSNASGDVVIGITSGGGLVGLDLGTISDSYATGEVSGGTRSDVGGLVGSDGGTIDTSWSNGAIVGGVAANVGGLVGNDTGSIAGSYATGVASGGLGDTSGVGSGIGGLVGYAQYAQISDSYATGKVAGTKSADLGGLVGYDAGSTITSSYASGNISDTKVATLGGLVGYSDKNASIETSHATGNVVDRSGGNVSVGGLIGFEDDSSTITGSWATGDVTGGLYADVGGLAGQTNQSSITDSHAKNSVKGEEGSIGGLVGYNGSDSDVLDSYARSSVRAGYKGHGDYASNAGGLVGANYGDVEQSYETGNVTGYAGNIGGLIGFNDYGSSALNSFATGNVTDGEYVGGFVGFNYGNLQDDYSTGSATDGNSIGGFAGSNGASSESAVQDCYWDTTTSGIKAANGTGMTGLTSAELKSALPAGFDDTVWAISPKINNGLPYLIALKSSY